MSEVRVNFLLIIIIIYGVLYQNSDLQSLELVHEAPQPFPLTTQFSKEFAKAVKLRFLKFTNFQVRLMNFERV